MKKTILIVLCIALVAASLCLLVSCKKDSELKIEKAEIEKTTYLVGDTYNQSDVKITATLTDGSTIDVTENLVFVGDDEKTLNLKDGKFTESGKTYEVTVYYIEAREDYKLGVWTIKVA